MPVGRADASLGGENGGGDPMRRTRRRTFDAIVEVLRDGAWHEIGDVGAATRFPDDWVDALRSEGLLEITEGVVTMVRLRPKVAGREASAVG